MPTIRSAERRKRRWTCRHARSMQPIDERMILVDHALGHGRRGERQAVPLDERAQQVRDRAMRIAEAPSTAIGRLAAAISSPARAIASSGAAASRCGAAQAPAPASFASAPAPRPPADRDAPALSARCSASRIASCQRLADAPASQRQRRLGDRARTAHGGRSTSGCGGRAGRC